MELSDLATRLPPRKRLLAGLKNPNPNFDLELPLPAQLTSTETGFRIREIMNSPKLSSEEAIHSLKSIALAASEAAAAARIVAMEKADVATKAKENAKKALELLDSLSSGKKSGRKVRGRPKLKKKHVSMEVICKAEESANYSRDGKKVPRLTSSESRDRVSDEEVAKKLHRAMNSSPRISTCKEKVVVCAKTDFDEGRNENCPMERPRVKRKRLFLNRVDEREAKRLKPKTSFVDCREKIENQNSSKDGSNSNKLTSVWRCIKFKTSKCASDTKILHRTGTKASAIVEAE
ncbi:hypothetical protein FCM35_KLT10173 [Carex littledalei]|uniref:Uncharacterized protein n=1 Tax=Carex littledalei TaxID=544730 RepID=A0A833S094_9POAL|nr:hypothetical protein FCM35_KLT10173 [Carex littledalei]